MSNPDIEDMQRPLVSLSIEDVAVFERTAAPRHQGLAVGVDRAENVLQLASDRVQAIHSKYQQNSDVINTACKAVGSLIESDLAKKSTLDVLAVAKKVVSALDCVQQIHPFVGVAVLAFKGIIAFEITRRENDKRVSALILQGSDLMVELLQLNDLPPDPAVAVPGGPSVKGRLQSVLENIVQKIKDCGNAIDKYYKSKLIARLFKSPQWADQFKALADGFAQLKSDVLNALAIRTAVRIEDVSAKLDKIYALITSKTEQEKDFDRDVRNRGGLDACLNSSSKIRELAEKRGEMLKDEVTGKNKGLEAALLYDLRTPLETLLEDNRTLFEVTLKAQTSQIEDAIKNTETRLLEAFSAGPYKRIKDPHLRHVWKIMKWSLSVETPYFIAAVYDYFADRFSQALVARAGSTTPSMTSLAPLSAIDAPSQEDFDEPLPPVSLSDEWCLAYLDIFYVPALKEAFDDDTNGLVNVREVNSFCNARHLPAEWEILQRLAYAAAGWHVEMSMYCSWVQGLLNQIVYLQDDVLRDNRVLVCAYQNSDGIGYLKLLARGLSEPSHWAVELTELAEQRIKQHQAQLQEQLEAIKYEIPSDDFVPLYFGKGRVEQHLLPLLYALLRRHVEIIMFGQHELLEQRELATASWSLVHVVNQAISRKDHLEESFRQQGMDPDAKFATIARGLYAYLWDQGKAPDDVQYWREHQDIASDLGVQLLPINESQLRYGVPRPVRPIDSTEGHDEDARMKKMDDYIALAKLAALDALRFMDGPTYLPEDKADAFQALKDSLSVDDLGYCDAVADLQLRHSTVVHRYGCNGCERSPVLGTLYDCLDCGDGQYQLCSECAVLATDAHAFPDDDHAVTHNMLRYNVEISMHRATRLRLFAQERLCYHLSPTEYTGSDTGSETESDAEAARVEVKPETMLAPRVCSNCDSELSAAFYCCITCPDLGKPKCYLCSTCIELTTFCGKAAEEHSVHGHWLVLIRDLEAPSATGKTVPKKQEPAQEQATIEILAERADQMQTRITALEANVEKILGLVQALAGNVQNA